MVFRKMISVSFSVIVVLFAVSIGLHDFHAMATAPPLTKLNSAVAKGAVCLDGSPPAYQLDFGENEGANNWLLHFEGGYWCTRAEDCKTRAENSEGLGSSTKMKRVGFTGILSNKSELNPYFYNWNRVYLRYCDGSSFTGDKEEIDPEYGLYYRGGRIFDSIINELLKLGMRNATNALLSGCSAGGLAAILHCDKFHDLLPPTANVKCLSDAGFFLVNASGSNNHEMFYSELAQLHGSAAHLPASCTSKMKASLCFNAQNIVPNIYTPIFLLSSAYDTFQVANILLPKELSDRNETSCKYDLEKCPAGQLEKWEKFRFEFLQALSDLGSSPTRGLFINSCHAHCQSQFQMKWLGDPYSMLENKTISDAVGEWFYDRRGIRIIDYVHNSPVQCVVDPTEPYACNNYTWGRSSSCK